MSNSVFIAGWEATYGENENFQNKSGQVYGESKQGFRFCISFGGRTKKERERERGGRKEQWKKGGREENVKIVEKSILSLITLPRKIL